MSDTPTATPPAAGAGGSGSMINAKTVGGSLGGLTGLGGLVAILYGEWTEMKTTVADLKTTQSQVVEDVKDAKAVLCLLAKQEGITIPECLGRDD